MKDLGEIDSTLYSKENKKQKEEVPQNKNKKNEKKNLIQYSYFD